MVISHLHIILDATLYITLYSLEINWLGRISYFKRTMTPNIIIRNGEIILAKEVQKSSSELNNHRKVQTLSPQNKFWNCWNLHSWKRNECTKEILWTQEKNEIHQQLLEDMDTTQQWSPVVFDTTEKLKNFILKKLISNEFPLYWICNN